MNMNLARFLRPQSIKLELETNLQPGEESTSGQVDELREGVLWELVELFAATGRIVNATKLYKDLLKREKSASTAYSGGVALPHVRSMQSRSLVMAFARSSAGIPFGAPDDSPSHIFLGMVAPPYDDRTYLKVYRALGPILKNKNYRERLLAARDKHQILRFLQSFRR